MKKKITPVERSDVIPGLKPVDPAVLLEFEREMNEKVIPEIIAALREEKFFEARILLQYAVL